MKTTETDLILNRVAVDKLAKVVTSKCNHQQLDYVHAFHISSMTPLPTAQFTGPYYQDLTNKKVGRLTVIGFSLWRSVDKQNASRWVVKCACGRYELRTTKSIKKNRSDAMCRQCDKVNSLKRADKWASLDLTKREYKLVKRVKVLEERRQEQLKNIDGYGGKFTP